MTEMKLMYKVLLVDDEKWILDELKSEFCWEEYGFTIQAAITQPNIVLQLIKRLTPDLIILDIIMPGVDGFSLISKIKETGYSMPLIILSAHSQFQYTRHAIRLGIFDYLQKPIDYDELAKTIINVKAFLDSKKSSVPEITDTNVINLILNNIHLNYGQKQKLSDYAEKYFMNANYLSQLFKQKTGETFINYLINVRIKKATELLENSNESIASIAQKVGYSDYAQFVKIFKKYTGKTPTEYRK